MASEILVLGAGPVGLAMAAELARYGVTVRIIDKSAHRSEHSKALVLWSRTLELIDRMGCASAFDAAGVKVTATNMWAGGRRIGHVSLDQLDTPHPYALLLPQSETERLLEAHLNACGVQVERQVEVLGFEPRADSVMVTMRGGDGREERLRTDWLIGCDGAHSTVRHGLSMPFEGSTLPSDWMLADVHLAGVQSSPHELDMYWHADGALAMFPISAGRYRLIADVGDAASSAPRPEPTLADVQEVLDRRGPGGIVASEPVWLSSFRINERKVADYRAGRVFLAGDAAHVHSPAGGQGMNTGIQDACNLAWKLALVCRGEAHGELLLDSYGAERGPVARRVLQDTGRLTTLAVLKGGVMQALRNHVVSLLFGLGSVREAMATNIAELSIGYPDSPLNERGVRGKTGPAAGQRAPLSGSGDPVGAGRSPRFALCAAADDRAAALIARFPNLLEPTPRAPFAEEGIWLVRPDGYVALAADRNAWDEVVAYFGRVGGGGVTAPA